MQKYDVFISYRRQGGEVTARILCERFTDIGYKVFFDVENLRSGDFNEALYDVIGNCRDFLMVLSPGALDRCENENDWVRKELAFALEHDKNVVPIMLRGFDFPPNLPKDIDAVRFKNGLEASAEFFDAFIEKLRGFLKSKPAPVRRIMQNTLFKKTLPFLVALTIICVMAAGGYVVYDRVRPKVFPHTQEQKNITNELLAITSNVLLGYNNIVSYERGALNGCSNYLSAENPVALENALTTINQSINQISKIDASKSAITESLNGKLDNTPIDKSCVTAFMNDYAMYPAQAIDNLRIMRFVIQDSVYDISSKRDIVNLRLRENELTAKYVVYFTNAVTLPIDRVFLSDFYQSLTYLTALPYEGYRWLDDEDEIEHQLTINLNKLADIANELTIQSGDQTIQYVNEVEKYRKSLKDMGLSQEQINESVAAVVRSSRRALELKESIQKLEERILAKKDSARQKFAPVPSDDKEIIWGKMLRFLTLKMYDDAEICLAAYRDKVSGSDMNADAYISATQAFIQNINSSGVDYGALVMGFEPGKESHEIFEIGDIVVAVNGSRCLDVDSFINFKVKAGDCITVLRYVNSQPVYIDKTVVPNQSKALFGALTERIESDG